MNKIPTAEEFCIACTHKNLSRNIEPCDLIEFAKLHCEEQARIIANKARMIGSPVHNLRLPDDTDVEYITQFNDNTDDFMYRIDPKTILEAYPLTNIK